MSGLKAQIQEQSILFLKGKKQKEAIVLRSLMAEIKQVEIDQNNRVELNDEQVLAVIEKMIKQRRQSIDLFAQGGRQDLVEKESFEIELIEKFLPTPLNETEVQDIIRETLTQAQAKTIADMGKVMDLLKPKLRGRADIAQASKRVKEMLSGHS